MKLTQSQEASILQDYQKLWEANLSGDMETLASYLVDGVSSVGTANGEIFFTKKEVIGFLSATAQQTKGKVQYRDRKITVQPFEENCVIVQEASDVFVLLENAWSFYGFVRSSCVLKQVENKWKAVHLHASLPDHRTEEGQQIALEKIEQENLQLREAVKRRTIELEGKNRELHIEACIEQVRSRSMAMHKSDELKEVVAVLFQKLKELELPVTAAGIGVYNEGTKDLTCYVCGEQENGLAISSYRLPYFPNKICDDLSGAREKGTDFFVGRYTKKEKDDFYDVVLQLPELSALPPDVMKMIMESPAYTISMAPVSHAVVNVNNFSGELLTDGEVDILKRFAQVFNQAYIRFLDLQKAEAQTREAQIETAVERVRAQSMAMYKTSDLYKVNEEILSQLNKLNVVGLTGVSIYLVDEDDVVKVWDLSSPGNISNPSSYSIKYDAKKYPILGGWVETWKTSNQDYFVLDFSKEALIMGVEEFKEILPEMAVHLKGAIESGQLQHQWNPCGRLSDGILAVDLMVPPTEDTKSIVTKMAGAFNLAYQRFQDLQKAEAQAREAQIESALERVRSRSLAMHHTSEIQSVIHTVHNELLKLNISIFGGSFIVINKDVEDGLYAWGAGATAETTTKVLVPDFGMFFCTNLIEGIKTGSGFFTEEFSAQQKISYFTKLFKQEPWSEIPDADKKNILESDSAYTRSVSVLDNTSIFIVNQNGRKFSAEENDILRRFSKVFEQSYTRFLDLQKAEAQAREAQVNLAVERVRARALAMYSSEEILEVVFKLKEEVMNLNIPNVMAATIHMLEKNGKHRMWDISSMEAIEGKLHLPLDISFRLAETDPNFFVRRVWTNTEKYFLVTQDEKDLKRTTQWLKDNGKTKEADETEEFIKATGLKKLYHPTIQLNSGRMSIDLLEPPSPEIESILTKMGAAFDLAHTRFEDLKNSEAQLKEAQTEAALEKVRARTMAMQHSDELADASRLLEEEVRKLGIETWGCAFHIYDEENTDEHPWDLEWFTSPAGMLPFYKTPRENVFLKYYNEGKKGTKLHIEEIGPDEIKKHYDYLKSIPIMGDALKEMSRAGIPLPQMQFDHVAFFKQGHLLFITYKPVPEAHDIFIRFAKIFDQTYTRFLDLKMAEAQALRAEKDLLEIKAARTKAEKALIELRATQQQLIQSEKMASLGELTAGIAHEIQNPLNFVNNFSELSDELVDEMNEELRKGDVEEAKAIAADIKDNLQKIAHHGKRADAIVKGMLQHSRANSGQKEPTDINALCDEYLRLSYHGLRAKNKDFNADFKTDFCPSVGKVNIVPQDVGRVILNLVNNAFYAVNEKRKTAEGDYQPFVKVSTKLLEDCVEVKVFDNGGGIPKAVVDKIFQPFFTTKPTGEGTGLGLSMSYDIITKGHNGTLTVETSKDKSTTFIINLPA